MDEFSGVLSVRRWGNSLVVVLPPELKDFFGVVHRDLLAYRKCGRMVVLRRIQPKQLVPLTESESQEAGIPVGNLGGR